jgi:putative membrane protein
MLFVWHGSVLRNILVPLGVILAISLSSLLFQDGSDVLLSRLNPVPFSLIGVALAIFVSFRNTACYDRFWEARKLWGELLNHARNLSRLAVSLPGLAEDDPSVRELGRLLCGFADTLRHQLRGTDPHDELQRRLGPALAGQIMARQQRPAYVLNLITRHLAGWHRQGHITDILLQTCLLQVDSLSTVLGGCERIAGTPIPYAYNVLLHRTIYFYCALLPFGLVSSIGPATPVICVFIAYAFMALDAIASELEDPFGEQPNDLPLSALCNNIHRAVFETFEETSLPVSAVVGEHFRLN